MRRVRRRGGSRRVAACVLLALVGCFKGQPTSEVTPEVPPPAAPARRDAASPAHGPLPAKADEEAGVEAPESAAPQPEPRPATMPSPEPRPAPTRKLRRRRAAEKSPGIDRSAVDHPELDRSRRSLDRAEEIEAADCPSARRRSQAICDLAEKICGLVDRDPNVASVEHYCESARARCRRAGARTAERCD